jgi:hypothetical protein
MLIVGTPSAALSISTQFLFEGARSTLCELVLPDRGDGDLPPFWPNHAGERAGACLPLARLPWRERKRPASISTRPPRDRWEGRRR